MKAYLDCNATTRMAPGVLEAMLPFLTDRFGNPSSFHSFGSGNMTEIDRARERVAALIGARPEEICFTSGGTESDNMALRCGTGIDPDRPGLVTSAVEHPAVLRTAECIRKSGGEVGIVEVSSDGSLDAGSMGRCLNERTGLVSVMMANNETGIIMPPEDASCSARKAGALFHTDAVQAAGKIPVDVDSMGIDLLSLSAHKLHGPRGVGALFIRSGVHLEPFITGGGQERGMRAGTYDTAGIVGFGKAAELAFEHLSEETGGTGELRDMLENRILASCPGAEIVGKDSPRLPNTSMVLFRGIESEAILTLLDMEGVCVSSGSACSSGSSAPSHVLSAMGIEPLRAGTSIRFSLSRYTTEEEVEYAARVLHPVIEKLGRLSPYS